MLCQILMSDPVFGRWTLFVILIKLKTKNNNKKAIPVFFFVYRRMRFLTLGRTEKKNLKKKSQEVSEYQALIPQDDVKSQHSHIWMNKMHNILSKMFSFLFLFFSMLSLCSILRLKGLFQVKNVWTTSLRFFFFENAKNLDRSDDSKRRKKWGWPNVQFKGIKPLLSNLEFIISSMIS